jgi:hypothetical protein
MQQQSIKKMQLTAHQEDVTPEHQEDATNKVSGRCMQRNTIETNNNKNE